MNKTQYEKISAPFRKKPKLVLALKISSYAVTVLTALAYFTLLILLFFYKNNQSWWVLGVPFISFLLVSLLRYLLNKPRPYEQLAIQPLLKKHRKGCSFPSRHVFSISIIAMAFFFCQFYWIASILVFFSILASFIRVIAGVHFPIDTIFGLVFGYGLGGIGFYLLPFLFL